MPVTPQLISEVSSAPETLMLQSKWKKSAPDMSCFYSSQHQDTMIAYTNFCQLTLLKENYSAVHCHSKRPNKESYQEASCAHVKFCSKLLKPKAVAKCCLKWSEEVDSPSVCFPKGARVSCSVKSKEKYTTKLIKPKEWHYTYKWKETIQPASNG